MRRALAVSVQAFVGPAPASDNCARGSCAGVGRLALIGLRHFGRTVGSFSDTGGGTRRIASIARPCWKPRAAGHIGYPLLPAPARFAPDSPLEGAGFEPSVPRPIFNGFEASYELEPTDPRRGGSTSVRTEWCMRLTGRASDSPCVRMHWSGSATSTAPSISSNGYVDGPRRCRNRRPDKNRRRAIAARGRGHDF